MELSCVLLLVFGLQGISPSAKATTTEHPTALNGSNLIDPNNNNNNSSSTKSVDVKNNTDRCVIETKLEQLDNDLLRVEWAVSTSSSSHGCLISLSGFLVGYTFLRKHGEDNSNSSRDSETGNGLEFTSTILPSKTRSISLRLALENEARVCAYYVTSNESKQDGGANSCADWSKSERGAAEGALPVSKMISGIAAGCVFLLPCIAVLLLIMRKDKQMKMAAIYEEKGSDYLNAGFLVQSGEEGPKILENSQQKRASDVLKGACSRQETASNSEMSSGEEMTKVETESGSTIHVHSADTAPDTESYNERL